MPYELLCIKEREEGGARALGESVYLGNLPANSDVFLFYYPGVSAYYGDLESKLRMFGEQSGKSVFVNMGKLADENYRKIVNDFEVQELPSVILTGKDAIAGVNVRGINKTTYVRLDNKHLLKDGSKAISFIEKIVNLFFTGKISRAVMEARHMQRMIILSRVKEAISNALKTIEEISVGLFDGTFKIRFRNE